VAPGFTTGREPRVDARVHESRSERQGHIAASVGILNEGHLHASLKAHYVQPGDKTEVAVDGYVVDILRDGLIIEIQTGHFSKIARKMRRLVDNHRVRLVYPVPRDLWIVKTPRTAGDAATRRKSPKHLAIVDVFDQLVSFPDLIAHQNFELDAVLTEEETVWRFEAGKRWRRRGWVTIERRLLQVYETVALRNSADYLSLIPAALPKEFATSDLATQLGCQRRLAQKVAYCLKNGGLIKAVGARGNAIVYAKVRASSSAGIRSGAAIRRIGTAS
jgi:hypothetical protein